MKKAYKSSNLEHFKVVAIAPSSIADQDQPFLVWRQRDGRCDQILVHFGPEEPRVTILL